MNKTTKSLPAAASSPTPRARDYTFTMRDRKRAGIYVNHGADGHSFSIQMAKGAITSPLLVKALKAAEKSFWRVFRPKNGIRRG